MNYKAVIIDDETRGCLSLQKMLQHSCPEIEVAALAHSGAEGIEKINEHQPQLIFLDIQMPDMTGFNMLEQLEAIGFDIIFTTAFDQYAIKAFRFSAVDYLLKPIDMDELKEAVHKFRQRREGAQLQQYEQFNSLFHQITLKKIALPMQEGLMFVNIDDIIRLQSTSNYTTFYLSNKKSIMVSKTLGDFETLLEPHYFYRTHNSHIINLAHAEKYLKGEGGTVVMSDKSEIEVSRRKKEEFLKKLEEVALRKI